ncbi:MAG: hypothetical protein MUF51_10135 [Vicinamibacteria bacterium]|jgi:hypothetical protein|nr:hypothetical protein [Vicinamibacteria bacterium]
MSDNDLKEEIERLRKENERLKQNEKRGLHFKVSEKGALSVYGLGRFPVTLYKEQWRRLLLAVTDIQAFLADNDHLLKSRSGPDGAEK